MLRNPDLALDRSMRRKDADGHLHVELTNISKANVCPYYGREIPRWNEFGLDPDRIYQLYRDPAELAAGASTFDGKPLLLHHKPLTSEDHPEEMVVGAVGTGTRFEHPYLKAPLAIWRQDAIDAVEADPDKDPDAERELSSGYRYDPDMTPGKTPEGVAFDGVMRNIRANHVAIVKEGRAGPDVVVADAALKELPKMRFPTVMKVLAAIIPSMKASEALALDDALAADALKEVKGVKHCVEDEFPDMSEDSRKTALDAFCSKTGKAMDALTDEDKREAYKSAKDGKPATGSAATGQAADAAIKVAVDTALAEAATKAQDATKVAVDSAVASVHALYAARRAVEDKVGEVTLDSAEAVYRFALDHLKVDHKSTPVGELAALYEKSAKPAAPAVAQDSAAAFDVTSIWKQV